MVVRLIKEEEERFWIMDLLDIRRMEKVLNVRIKLLPSAEEWMKRLIRVFSDSSAMWREAK